MAQTNLNQLASLIWSVADLLRGDFKRSQYGRIILPFTLLRRLECVLEGTQDSAITAHKKYHASSIDEAFKEKAILREINHGNQNSNFKFYNASPLQFSQLSANQIGEDLHSYIQGFSVDAREIFDNFKFDEFIDQLQDANLLYKVVEKFAEFDLSIDAVSNHEMGLLFEELIRKFAESSNETAGEHFTPRDIVELTTSLLFDNDDDALTKPGVVRTIYDPTAGTGGFLSSGSEHMQELNKKAVLKAYGQELNSESYAICKADMLIKGEDVQRIKLGNTLSQDKLESETFDYMLSNPPFGVDWKKIEGDIKKEHQKGKGGRFSAGLPRVSDGSLLFLMHLISKMHPKDAEYMQGSRIGIILNGSPLFTGGAGSGESEIRRSILENDLLEAIIALPTDMFYNTGIATYIWILSNKKSHERQGKVQLIDATHLHDKMRKSLGSKRHQINESNRNLIVQTFSNFEEVQEELNKPEDQKSNRGRQSTKKDKTLKTFASKIFPTHAFGYRRVTIERPLRLSVALTNKRIGELEFAPKPFDQVMPALRQKFGSHWQEQVSNYGVFDQADHEDIKVFLKENYPELKAKQINILLDSTIWQFQQQLYMKAKALQTQLGDQQWNNWNQFEAEFKQACKQCNIKLDSKESKQLRNVCSWTNPDAEPVVKKCLKQAVNPLYGAFAYQQQVVEFEQDGDLRDQETIPLNPAITTTCLIEDYFKKEVQPHVSDAWINADKCDAKDDEIGIVGYEIPFNRHFYQYQPVRDLSEIDKDLSVVSSEIMQLLQEIHE